jgi:hypothetical protein
MQLQQPQQHTASYVLGSNVHGTVTTAATASTAVSSSYASNASNAISSSYALTASFLSAAASGSLSASFLVFSANNGSASYAVNANTAQNASQSAFLVFGANNGTASFAMTASNVSTSSYSLTSSVAVSSSWANSSSISISGSYSVSSSAALTASYALAFNSPVKAWSMVTWSYGATFSQPQLYLSSNVSAIRYLSTFTSGVWAWFQYGIDFTNALPSTNYILMGQAFDPYANPNKADVVFHPIYSNRTTTSCTMSLTIDTTLTASSAWFSAVSASYPSSENPYLAFQVLG